MLKRVNVAKPVGNDRSAVLVRLERFVSNGGLGGGPFGNHITKQLERLDEEVAAIGVVVCSNLQEQVPKGGQRIRVGELFGLSRPQASGFE